MFLRQHLNRIFLAPADRVVVPTVAEIPGIDFSFTHPSPQAIKNAGFTFVMGYVSPSASKNLTAAEINAYRAVGLQVGLVWEYAPGRAAEGSTSGVTDGIEAERQMNALGNYPASSVIFFAVDYDAQPADFTNIAAYATGFNSKTSHPVGIYGSYRVIERFVTAGVQPVQYGWQTAAWSAGQVSAKANLFQRASLSGRYPPIAGVGSTAYDENVKLSNFPIS